MGHEAEFDKVLRVFTFGICVAVLGFAMLLVPLLQILASDRYLPAYEVAALIALALGIQGIGWITEIGIHISFKSYFLPIGYGLGILTTVLVLWVFLPRWGLIATGIGVVCAKTIVAGTLTVIAQRIQPMAWSFRPVIMSIGLTLAIILAGLWVGRVYGLIGFAGVAAGGLVVFLPLGGLILFTAAERGQLRAMISGVAKG